ncbi:MAG: hypothetical protein QY332_10800 [Anaerolineales bacterium]|nr:MAG: hypothetical protein QY332_10800 [Anaerolineales bacterium]
MKNKNKMLLNILNWIRKIDIYWLVLSPSVLAIILLIGLLYLGDELYRGEIPEPYFSLSWVVFLLVASLSGFAQVIRREGPGPFGGTSYGMWPVISGYLIIIITWAAAIAFLIMSI